MEGDTGRSAFLDSYDDVSFGWVVNVKVTLTLGIHMDLNARRILVLGLGATGLSMARWLSRQGAQVSVADTRANPPYAAHLRQDWPKVKLYTGPFSEGLFSDAQTIALSPGIDPRQGELAQALANGKPVVGDIELFAQALSERRSAAKIIAITGSNGKSTVTALCGAVCQAQGWDTVVAGNIGLPVLDVLTEIDQGRAMPDVFVLELSSFQLETCVSLRADVATVLNVTEDHMDRYDTFNDYRSTKSRIFLGSHTQVLNRDDPLTMAMALSDRVVVSFGVNEAQSLKENDWGLKSVGNAVYLCQADSALLAQSELPLVGLHNVSNVLAAGALCCAIGVEQKAWVRAVQNFKGLPHRVEKIGQLGEVSFFDDSKGTNVGATVAALEGFSHPVVLIAGGDGKGQDFTPLVAAVKARARAVILIGRDAPHLQKVLSRSGIPILLAADLTEAVHWAYAQAQAGEGVLLSPACASFDMFRHYIHRAEVFVEAFKKLSELAGTCDV
ncbi:MAG: UDP-N-acetylmuramoyl-L-alanine--D-glutamate ligase [Betaproteobacteria bacterium]